MADLEDGDSAVVSGSGTSQYTLKNTGGVYSCTCPAWMHQSLPIEKRTCKHLRRYRGDAAETERIGTTDLPGRPTGDAAKTEGPPVMLANKWQGDVDPRGWWLSEKLDGVRAYWDGEQFLSRLGNRYHAPDWFVAKLPDHPLDGELWGGRKKFQRTISIVRRQDKSDHWKEIEYLVFDAPALEGGFERRLDYCQAYHTEQQPPFMRVVDHVVCRDKRHLAEELARVEGLGGEGLMMRQPGSKYVAGRSSALLKVKNFHDAEARVIGHLAGTGRHKGRLGALAVELSDGTGFSVGTGLSDAERESPPPIGSIITFRYQELSDGGVPRFPSYVGVRDDFAWPGAAIPAATPGSSQPHRTSASPAANGARPGLNRAPKENSNMARYEFKDGKSNKFWEIALDGDSFTTCYGRIGTDGQSTLKEFATPAKAKAACDKLIAEKVKKGYLLVGDAAEPEASDDDFDDEGDTEDGDQGDDEGDEEDGTATGARRFELKDGKSNKFWEVTLDGNSFTARYGRIGSDGQTTLKEFADAAKAKAACDKLIAEKVKKGYQES